MPNLPSLSLLSQPPLLTSDIYLLTARKQPTPPFYPGACVVAVFPSDVTNIIDIWVQQQEEEPGTDRVITISLSSVYQARPDSHL